MSHWLMLIAFTGNIAGTNYNKAGAIARDTNCDLFQRKFACHVAHVMPKHVKRIVYIYDLYG